MNSKPQYPRLDFTTDVARLLSGNLATPSDKGYKGEKRETPQYFFAIGIPKNAPRAVQTLTDIQNHTFQSYGSMGAGGAGVVQRMQSFPIASTMPGGATAPFAWKIEDGDHPDNAGKEGWSGCWILKFTTTFPFGVCDQNNNQLDPAAVKLGWWVEVAGNAVINGQTDHTAGIHLNPRFVRVVGYDKEITPGPSPDQVFGAPPAALPPGVSATPVAPAQPMPGQQQYQQAPAVGNYTQPPAPAPASPPQTSYPPQQPANYAPSASTAAPAGSYSAQPAAPGNLPPAAGTPPPAQAPTAYNPAPPPAVPAPGGSAPAAYGQPQAMPSGTAYPSNQPPTGVQPHPGFTNGGQQ